MGGDVSAALDDLRLHERLDPSRLRDRIGGLPLQCLHAWEMGLQFSLPPEYREARNVIVAGVGGSAIGGELMADLISKEGSPLVTVCRDYHLPPYLGPDSLVIASSYSGNTEETVAAFEDALERGAKVVAVTTGGRLLQLAERAGVPVFRVDYQGEPRTALGYSFLVPLAMLQNLGLSPNSDEAVTEAAEVLVSLGHSLKPETPTQDNPAKELALTLHGKMIVVYGGGMLCGVARRWKTQLNENAKAWAFVELLPEAGHNAIAGLWWPRPMGRNVCGVLLNTLSLHPRIKLRYQVIHDLLARAGVECRTVDGVGQSPLAQILSSVMFGDFTSYYLALLNGEDPSPVPPLDYLKNVLRRSTYDHHDGQTPDGTQSAAPARREKRDV
ncbi:MAG: bifunctional phosphoglucose/phosphomannose isomerase [Chloroflexota bacterium]|nr:bifunctional phosphoglucose/phosphomannose isomerase [Chloroflexota bacterium]MDE2941762.1 bifunctional phosphoglucose/phosphomannose isomerase [Chloroflexota bacterium]